MGLQWGGGSGSVKYFFNAALPKNLPGLNFVDSLLTNKQNQFLCFLGGPRKPRLYSSLVIKEIVCSIAFRTSALEIQREK